MGQKETKQVSRVRTHVPSFNASPDTLDIRLYIPKNNSEYSLYEHTAGHGYVMPVILIELL